MKNSILVSALLILLSTATVAETKSNIPAQEVTQIFHAAGFKKTRHGWQGHCDTGEITIYRDLNGDGLKDAVISDYSSMCYGNTGTGYYMLTQQKNGT